MLKFGFFWLLLKIALKIKYFVLGGWWISSDFDPGIYLSNDCDLSFNQCYLPLKQRLCSNDFDLVYVRSDFKIVLRYRQSISNLPKDLDHVNHPAAALALSTI